MQVSALPGMGMSFKEQKKGHFNIYYLETFHTQETQLKLKDNINILPTLQVMS